MPRFLRIITIVMLLSVSAIRVSHAEQSPSRYDVFIETTGKADARTTSLYFVDARTGLSSVAQADGLNHTLIATGVIFLNAGSGAALIATPDGGVAPFTPIRETQTVPGALVDWAVSPDHTAIVWTITYRQESIVFSDVYVSTLVEGQNIGRKLAFHASSTQGLGVLPLAVTNDATQLFYTRRTDLFDERPDPLTIGSVWMMNTTSGDTIALPDVEGEAATDCPCITTVMPNGNALARLLPNANGGFDLRLWDLTAPNGSVQTTIQAPQTAHRVASTLLFSLDARFAAYFTAPGGEGRTEYALVVVDLGTGQQRIAASGLRNAVHPIQFTTGSGSVIAVYDSTAKQGTVKIALATGDAIITAGQTYLGAYLVE